MKKALSTNLTSEQELKRTYASLSITPEELTTVPPQLREEELKRLDSISRTPGTVFVFLLISLVTYITQCLMLVLNRSTQDWRFKYVQLPQSWLKLQYVYNIV